MLPPVPTSLSPDLYIFFFLSHFLPVSRCLSLFFRLLDIQRDESRATTRPIIGDQSAKGGLN